LDVYARYLANFYLRAAISDCLLIGFIRARVLEKAGLKNEPPLFLLQILQMTSKLLENT
jgi:hypothetical protein